MRSKKIRFQHLEFYKNLKKALQKTYFDSLRINTFYEIDQLYLYSLKNINVCS